MTFAKNFIFPLFYFFLSNSSAMGNARSRRGENENVQNCSFPLNYMKNPASNALIPDHHSTTNTSTLPSDLDSPKIPAVLLKFILVNVS